MRCATASRIFRSCATASPTPSTSREARHVGGDDPVQVAEPVDQAAGERLHILPRDRAEEQKLQQLVIRHGGGPALLKPGPEPLAVIGDVGRQPSAERLGQSLVLVAGEEGKGRFLKGASRTHSGSLGQRWLQMVNSRHPDRGAGSREPGAGSREPGAGSREPGAGSREPGAGSREPGAGSRGSPEGGPWQEPSEKRTKSRAR